MNYQQYFEVIDKLIDDFNIGIGYQINKDGKSDWLIFEWRQLTRVVEGVNHIIEIFPNFNDLEEITSWTLYASAWYDTNTHRYYLSKNFATQEPLAYLTEHLLILFNEAHDFLKAVKIDSIPVADALEG